MDIKILRRVAIGLIIAILVLTALEFPAPIGFETRPQDNVSFFWLAFFLVILVSEIAAIPLMYTWPAIAARLGVFAAALNILQVVADQTHMMQPEVAAFGYLLLEDSVSLASLVLSYFCWKIIRTHSTLNPAR